MVFDRFKYHRPKKGLFLSTFQSAKDIIRSQDLNPIEKMWSKVKSILRTLKTRTKEALIDAIAKALERVTASDAKGWFESCGYIFS